MINLSVECWNLNVECQNSDVSLWNSNVASQAAMLNYKTQMSHGEEQG